jgi:DNA-binding transcriptional regulator YdaS (Cro superfamily)
MVARQNFARQPGRSGGDLEMKLSLNSSALRRRTRAAVTLIECLVYIGVLATLLGVSTSAFYRCYEHMRSLRRNADDITRALHLGELWRNDVRQAIQPPALDATEQILHIQHKDGVVDYCFAEDQVLRRTAAAAPWSSVLTNLNQSQIHLEQQNGVAAWRWELELKPLRKPARVPPLFTFTAVPESPTTP